jgi:hypothetical protein
MASCPDQLWEMAAECQSLAAAAKNETVREQLLDVAEQFERLAHERRLRDLTRD